jgi:hypothetical protein
MEVLFAILGIALLGSLFVYASARDKKQAEAIRNYQASHSQEKAERDSRIVCPHCQEKGYVTTSQVIIPSGVSGGKLTAAFLTLGLSLLLVGLSREEMMTQARCANCGSNWRY